MKTIVSAMAGCLVIGAAAQAFAHGSVQCSVPEAEWKPQMDLQRKLVDEGWKVRRVQHYHGCYEVYGFDEKGARAEAFFNPKTFERVESPVEAEATKEK